MTIAVITLSIALALAISGLIAAFVSRARLGDDLATERALLVTEQRRGDELERQRDAALVEVASSRVEVAELKRRLVLAEFQRNEAVAREADRAGAEVRTAPDAVAAANRVLEAARARRAAADSAAADRASDGGAPAVQPAVAPDAAAPRRST